ncbi:sensor histidine kinase [Alkalihalobacillus oceani]|uniref:cache domain-containing sensor histidine kinase n=1 Tax=Halalkalibacter oceani TaxID=1653776 RepID=UPI00203E20A6|nr:sensor histidine kinase [Halalkalibacter oceani]MCM3762697.1 sensor histidine kinase [Halalkalibacter oceani]
MFRKSIKVRLLAYFLLISLLPILLVGFIPYYKSQEIVQRQVLEFAQSTVNQLNENITYYLKEMDLMARIIYYQLQLSVNQDEQSANDDALFQQEETEELLMELKNNRPFIEDIHVVAANQQATTANGLKKEELEATEWFSDALTRIGEKTWVGPHQNEYTVRPLAGEVISLVHPFSIHDDAEIVTIIIEMKQEELNLLFTRPDLQNLGTLLLIDKFGEVIFSTDPEILEDGAQQYINTINLFEQLNQENRFIYDINFFSGWRIGALIPEELINESFHSIRLTVFILLGVFFCISTVLAWLFSTRFINPLRQLQRDIREVEKGNFQIRSEITSIDEIGDLSRSFNKMMREIETLIEQISINEKKKKQIEMQSLQYQINPHFLYNTLNSVQWIAKLHHVPDISEMLTNLIKLLRTSLNATNHLHMLEEELEVLSFYLKIQDFRYPDSYTISYDIPKELLSTYVPRFILQPLVENIFFHAFSDGKGDIKIAAIREDGLLRLRVQDNGRGMSAETIERIMAKKQPDSGKMSSGVGIHNVDDKIKLYFGSSYGLAISSQEENGTTIDLYLPISFEKEDGEEDVKRFISR